MGHLPTAQCTLPTDNINRSKWVSSLLPVTSLSSVNTGRYQPSFLLKEALLPALDFIYRARSLHVMWYFFLLYSYNLQLQIFVSS